MEIRLYIRMLQRGWWIIAITTLVALNGALLSAYMTQPMYRASARFSVSPSSALAASGGDVLNSLEALDKRSIVQTYAEFLNSQRIYQETVTLMGLDPATVGDYSRSTVVIPDANILELTVEGPNPELVARLANMTGQNAIEHIKQLYKVYDVNPLDPAFIPTEPVTPQPIRDASVAAMLGLVIGAGLAITSEQVRIPIDAYRQRASMDPVSMVYNHRYVKNRLDEFIFRNPEGTMSVGLVRLDALRDMIDSLPASVIQQLMREVTSVLRKELRGNDMIGRWNSLTFLLILSGTSEAAAGRTMERIRLALLKPVHLANFGETFDLDPTVSVASYRSGDTSEDLTNRAEYALEHVRIQESQQAVRLGQG